MTDKDWIAKEVPKADTPLKVLQLIVDNEQYFGYDPYYSDLRKAMLDQADKVLGAQG